MAEKKTQANLGFEKQIWDAACVLWGHIPAAEYRKVIVGLIFIRYISSAFDKRYKELVAEGDGFEDDRDAYEMDNIFFVPPEARWDVIAAAAHTAEIGIVLDNAMRAIEAENKDLKNVLPKNYANPDLDKRVLGDVVDIFTNMNMDDTGVVIMEQEIVNEVVCEMMSYLTSDQVCILKNVLEKSLNKLNNRMASQNIIENDKLIDDFVAAKRLEGCSEKTLKYYRNTIVQMLDEINKTIRAITTEDLREYLSKYQIERKISKVTVDNIRRNLSSFFAWLEDENYILKSPVRRIHRVKTTSSIKTTYSDEELEVLRDNCKEIRDLAMIDLLASTGMRVQLKF